MAALRPDVSNVCGNLIRQAEDFVGGLYASVGPRSSAGDPERGAAPAVGAPSHPRHTMGTGGPGDDATSAAASAGRPRHERYAASAASSSSQAPT
jgi:hypothetical protein